MACPGPPLCCDECCTHRLFIPEIEWSDNVFGKRCGRPLLAAPAVTASYRDGDFVYLVAEVPRLVDGVVRYGYYAEKWDKDGTREWRSDRLFTTTDTGFIDTDRSKATAITSDGSHCWVAIAENDATGGLSKMFRLDALDGDTLFEGELGASDELTIYSLSPTGDNKCYIGHGVSTNYSWVSTWDDDTLTDRFGVFGYSYDREFYVSSIIPDGSDIYLGHTVVTTDRFGSCQANPCDLCSPIGAVSRWDSNRQLIWLSYGGNQAKIAKSGSTVFVMSVGLMVYGALDDEWGDPTWFRTVDLPTIPDNSCGLTDIACDDNFLWLAGCRHIVQTDHDGILTSAVPHVHEDDIPFWNVLPYTPNGDQVLTVAAMQDDTAIGGGKANLCEPDTPLEPEELFTEEVACDQEANDFCESSVPLYTLLGASCASGDVLGEDGLCYSHTNVGWCNINQCGVVSTNGRVAISECTDHEQWPKCSGPGIITYTDCNDEVVTETLRFSSHCVDGGWRWFDSWDGGSIAFTVPCDGSFGPDDIDLTIDGCTVTVDSASITCDGPLGYASMEFTFSGTCGECAINGCGAFGAESCETLISTDCCEGVPTELPVTMTSGVCSYANGVTGTATWNATLGEWECVLTLTTAVGDKTWGFAFFCPMAGGAPTDFTIRGLNAMSALSADCEPNMDYTASMGATCSPLSVTFSNVQFTGASACCDDGTPMPPAATATIVIG